MSGDLFVLVESNTTGSGRLFCARARELALRPVLLVADPGKYPYIESDEIEHQVLDTGDLAALGQACAALDGQIVAVTSSSEYFVATAAELAGSLGLPHPDPAAVRACRDKASQRRALRAAGLAGPDFASATDPDAAAEAAQRIGLPVVIKPTAGSGSIGVRRCADAGQVRAAADAILRGTLAGLPAQRTVLVEQYLDGPEFSVETLDEQVVGVTAKHLGSEPYFVEIGHDFPAPITDERRLSIGEAALSALRALGLGWGPAHVELRLTSAGPRIVEVNPRLAGGMIPRMVEAATGIDLIGHAVARAAGRDEPVLPTRAAAASIRFLVAASSGWLAAVSGLDAARQQPGVIEVALTGQLGQDVVLRHSFQDRLGYVIASGEDGQVAARAADQALALLQASIAPAADAQLVGREG